MNRESQHVEWKEQWRDEYLKWVSAFANADGGTLTIGRDDRGVPVGATNARQLLEELPNKIRDLLGIVVEVEVNLVEEAGHELIDVVVDPYPTPISYRGAYHVRSGSTKQELKGAALDRFLLRKQGRHWDGVPVPGYAVDDLNDAAVQTFRKRSLQSRRLTSDVLDEPRAALLDKLNLIEAGRLKRAALLLFHSEPERVATGAYLKIEFFDDTGELAYHDTVHGDLFHQVDFGLDLIMTKYMKASIRYEGLQRVETFPVPDGALREALINAVIHKDYASGNPIQISVYDDQLMIWNNGELPPDWTAETLTSRHTSRPFNPDVAGTFFRSGLIEAWGRGIERIVSSCRRNGTPGPTFAHEPGGLWVTFPFAAVSTDTNEVSTDTGEISTDTDEASTDTAEVSTDTSEISTDTDEVSTDTHADASTDTQLLGQLADDPTLTLLEVADRLGVSTRTAERVAARLVQTGRLRRIGPRKSGHWEVLP